MALCIFATKLLDSWVPESKIYMKSIQSEIVVISHKYWEHTSPVPDTASEEIKHSSPKLKGKRMFVYMEKPTNYLHLLPYESTLFFFHFVHAMKVL